MENFKIEVGEKFLFKNELVQVLDIDSSGLLITGIQPENILSKNSFQVSWGDFLTHGRPQKMKVEQCEP